MSRPAPALRSVAALAAHDLRLTARRGENVLVTIVIPIAALLFFASSGVIPNATRPVDFLVPGAIALAIVAILVLEAVQLVALLAVGGLLLGWVPGAGWSPILFGVAALLGTVTFVGLGLLLAGTLRAEATLALANGLFLGFLMLGGIVLPIDHLPDALRPIATLLPATALADLLRISLASAAPASGSASTSVAILAAWAIGAAALTVRTFRWE